MAPSEKRAARSGAAVIVPHFHVRSTATARGEMRVAVPSISTQRRINWLKICRKTRERLTMMNDLCIDELLVSTNFCYCWS